MRGEKPASEISTQSVLAVLDRCMQGCRRRWRVRDGSTARAGRFHTPAHDKTTPQHRLLPSSTSAHAIQAWRSLQDFNATKNRTGKAERRCHTSGCTFEAWLRRGRPTERTLQAVVRRSALPFLSSRSMPLCSSKTPESRSVRHQTSAHDAQPLHTQCMRGEKAASEFSTQSVLAVLDRCMQRCRRRWRVRDGSTARSGRLHTPDHEKTITQHRVPPSSTSAHGIQAWRSLQDFNATKNPTGKSGEALPYQWVHF